MKVYKLVRSMGYIKNNLSHVSFVIMNLETDQIINVKNPTVDDYIHLCGRYVVEWMPWKDGQGIDIIVPMKKWDNMTFC